MRDLVVADGGGGERGVLTVVEERGEGDEEGSDKE